MIKSKMLIRSNEGTFEYELPRQKNADRMDRLEGSWKIKEHGDVLNLWDMTYLTRQNPVPKTVVPWQLEGPVPYEIDIWRNQKGGWQTRIYAFGGIRSKYMKPVHYRNMTTREIKKPREVDSPLSIDVRPEIQIDFDVLTELREHVFSIADILFAERGKAKTI